MLEKESVLKHRYNHLDNLSTTHKDNLHVKCKYEINVLASINVGCPKVVD